MVFCQGKQNGKSKKKALGPFSKMSETLLAISSPPLVVKNDNLKHALSGSILIYSRTSITRTSLEPWKFVRDMGSSSY